MVLPIGAPPYSIFAFVYSPKYAESRDSPVQSHELSSQGKDAQKEPVGSLHVNQVPHSLISKKEAQDKIL